MINSVIKIKMCKWKTKILVLILRVKVRRVKKRKIHII